MPPLEISTAPATSPERVNIARTLREHAGKLPDKPAVVVARRNRPAHEPSYHAITFRQLDEDSDALARGLVAEGLAHGMRTIVMVPPSIEFFVITFALFKIGAVPVLIDPGMGRARMVECLRDIQAEAFIGIPLAHLLRFLRPGAFRQVRITVTVGGRFVARSRYADLFRRKETPFDIRNTEAGEMAAILFTSGSTGPPKGAVYTHGMFDAQIRILNRVFGYNADEKDLATFPLFALFDTALGMTSVIPDMDATSPGNAEPEKIFRAIEDHGVTHMFGSPALLDRVARAGQISGKKLSTLKRVLSAGAPVRPSILEAFRTLLPDDAEIYTPYGATESLPVAVITASEVLAHTRKLTAAGWGTCVGLPVEGVDVRIIPIADRPLANMEEIEELPPGEVGEICVRGPNVTREYYANEPMTTLAKIRDGATLWHRTGDCGYFDAEGRLWFCGRKSHRVVMHNGATLFTDPVEGVFNDHPKVFRSALVGIGDPHGQVPVVCIELEPGHRDADKSALTTELLEHASRTPVTRGLKHFHFHPAFPVDIRHNAKIFREKLAVWAARQIRR